MPYQKEEFTWSKDDSLKKTSSQQWWNLTPRSSIWEYVVGHHPDLGVCIDCRKLTHNIWYMIHRHAIHIFYYIITVYILIHISKWYLLHTFFCPLRMASCQPVSQAPCQVSSCGSWSFQGWSFRWSQSWVECNLPTFQQKSTSKGNNQPLQTWKKNNQDVCVLYITNQPATTNCFYLPFSTLYLPFDACVLCIYICIFQRLVCW